MQVYRLVHEFTFIYLRFRLPVGKWSSRRECGRQVAVHEVNEFRRDGILD